MKKDDTVRIFLVTKYDRETIAVLLGVDKKEIADADIAAKAKELENINNKIEDREERWFELSGKIEG